MKNISLIFINFFLIFFSINSVQPSIENKIIVKVGNEIVTLLELENRINTSLILSNQTITQESINKVKNQSLRKLIDYKLKKSELKNYDFKTNQRAITEHLLNISKKLNIDPIELRKFFKINNIDYDQYLEEVKIEFLWQKLIVAVYSAKIKINEDQIQQEVINLIENQKNIEEFKVAEIELNYNNDSMQNLIKEIKESINSIGFSDTAVKYSNSTSALNGGEIGWIKLQSMSNNISDEIESLNIGDVSKPIINGENLIFLKVIDKRFIEINNEISTKKIKEDLINAKKSELLNLYSVSHLSKKRNNTLIEVQ